MPSDQSAYGSGQTQPQWSNQSSEGPWGSGPFDEASERPVGLGDPWGQSVPVAGAGSTPHGHPGGATAPPAGEGFPGSQFPADFSGPHVEDARRGMFPTAARPIVTPNPVQPQETYIADPADLQQPTPEPHPRHYEGPHGQHVPAEGQGQPPAPGYPSADHEATQHLPHHNGHQGSPDVMPPGSTPSPQPTHGQYQAQPHATPPHMQAPGVDGGHHDSGYGPQHRHADQHRPDHTATQANSGHAGPVHAGPIQPTASEAGVDLRGFDQQGASMHTAPEHLGPQHASVDTSAPSQPGVPPHAHQNTAARGPGMPGSHSEGPAPQPHTENPSDAGQPAAVPFGQTQHVGFHPGAKHPGASPIRGELPPGTSADGQGDQHSGQHPPQSAAAHPYSGQTQGQYGQGTHHSGQAQAHSGQASHHSGGAYQQNPTGYGPSGMPSDGQTQRPTQAAETLQPGATHAASDQSSSSPGFDLEAQKLPIIAIMSALIIGVIVGTILGVNLRGGGEETPAVSLPQDNGVTETSLPCEAGKSVAFIGAAIPPEAIFTASQTAQEFQAKAQSVGLAPSSVKMSRADQVCESALKNYSVPETGKMYVWGGTFDTPELAKEWCEKLGRSDFVKQCIIRTMA